MPHSKLILLGAYRYLSSFTMILGALIQDTRACLGSIGTFLWPMVCLTAPTRPTQEANINKPQYIKAQMLHDVNSFCRAFRGCRAHCRKTKTVSVVLRHALVSCLNVPSTMVKTEKYLQAPKVSNRYVAFVLRHPVSGQFMVNQ